MADLVRTQQRGVPESMKTRYRDMGDGTHALVVHNGLLDASGNAVDLAGTTTYSYMTAGYTRARNSAYTVPVGKTLYVTEFTVSYGYSTNQTHYARLYTRASQESSTGFHTGSIFYPYTEVVCANTSQLVTLDVPTKLNQRTDIKISGVATFAGIANGVLRGWLE